MKYLLILLYLSCPSADSNTSNAQDQEQALSGKWKVIQISGAESMNIFPTLEFDQAEKKMTGFAGCNNYFSSYTEQRNELTIGQAGATRKMCPDMTIEDLFLKKLSAIRQYKIDKKEMLLYDEKDQLVMLAIKE